MRLSFEASSVLSDLQAPESKRVMVRSMAGSLGNDDLPVLFRIIEQAVEVIMVLRHIPA